MIVEAESHHKREEDSLFPRLERRGISGPPSIMRVEHDELRKRKRALKELVDYIVPTLRSHIFKEDNILYPTALKVVPENEWSTIRSEFDEIGYCPFTPKHAVTVQ